MFTISSQHINLELTPIYRKSGRLHLESFLSQSGAEELFQAITNYRHWNLCTRLQQQHLDMDASVTDTWADERKQELLKFVHESAKTEFQYLYKTVPVYDLYHKQPDSDKLIYQIYKGLNSTESLAFFRKLTNEPNIGFVDCQITCFEPGHFLTCHDDAVEGKNRVAAYVLNLTHDWQPDWGGALHFYDEKGHTNKAYTPKFNALNLFAIGQPHAVSYVTPFAMVKRYAITGWLRKGEDPLLVEPKCDSPLI